MKQQREITIQIHCTDLPGCQFKDRNAVRLGIQRGTDIVDDIAADAEQVIFTAKFRVDSSLKTQPPNFLGPFAQGTPADRFIYLCWGERKGNEWDGFRRAKVRLISLGWDQLEASWESGEPIAITAAMTDAKGGPACGSLAGT